MCIESVKGFNENMTCTPDDNVCFQYEEGGEYEEPVAEICGKGFHGCEYPLDCFQYYQPARSVYHKVLQDGDVQKSTDDTKVVSTKISIGQELDARQMARLVREYLLNRPDIKIPFALDSHSGVLNIDSKCLARVPGWKKAIVGEKSVVEGGCAAEAYGEDRCSISAGDDSKVIVGRCGVADTGEFGTSIVGINGIAIAGAKGIALSDFESISDAGDRGLAVAKKGKALAGCEGVAVDMYAGTSSTKKYGISVSNWRASTGENGIAIAKNCEGLVKGGMGAVLIVIMSGWYPDNDPLVVRVDGTSIKADTWYKVENRKFVEAEEMKR